MKAMGGGVSFGMLPVFICFVLLFGFADRQAEAQVQAEAELHVPYGLGPQNLGKDGEGTGELLDSMVIVPDLRFQYYLGGEDLHYGPGFRLFSTVIDSLIYPTLSAEYRPGRLVINLNVGGGGFLFLGGYNAVSFKPVVLPELTTAYMLWERLGLGAGVYFVLDPIDTLKLGGITEGFAYVPTIFCRIVFARDRVSKKE